MCMCVGSLVARYFRIACAWISRVLPGPVDATDMFYALVEYAVDDVKAILPVSLVKNFNPNSCDDFDASEKLAYWRSSDGMFEKYYKAKILLLGETRSALIRKISKTGREVPDIIEPATAQQNDSEKSAPSQKAQKKNRAAAREKQMTTIIRKKQRRTEEPSEYSDSDDELIPKGLLRRQKRETKRLLAENQTLRKKLDEERELAVELQKALLKKHFSATSSTFTDHLADGKGAQCAVPLASDLEDFVTEEPSTVSPPSSMDVSIQFQKDTVTPTASLHQAESITHVTTVENMSTDVTSMDTPEVTIASSSNTEVNLSAPAPNGGHQPAGGGRRGVVQLPSTPPSTAGDHMVLEEGVLVPKDKFEWVMGASGDSRFCREMARLLWTTEQLQNRSVTGEACRRLLKEGATARKALTPVKMRAMAGAYHEYIKRHGDPSHSSEQRLGQMKKYLRNLLSDITRNAK
ncbi:BEN domain-containing protein 5-like isoform X2 [Ornithodoros turicata]|uniref:BEN domain-containing protein 5-like isoform X2 n=2 Tax=Ornithodoros turicata TaxID=34597 RepID=UPI0031389DBD